MRVLRLGAILTICNRTHCRSGKLIMANLQKKTFCDEPPKMEKNDWIVIGISGVTCGGKTSLAKRLLKVLTPAYLYHQDKYFYPDDSLNHVKCKDLDHNNYDILSALDMRRMHNDVMRTMNGEGDAHVVSTGRLPGRIEVPGKKFLIIEGFTVLNYKPLLELCNLRYYFVLEFSECFSRRVYRLYDPPDIDGYFEQCVWPEHIKYRAEIEKDRRVKLMDGMRQDTWDIVMTDLKALGAVEIRE